MKLLTKKLLAVAMVVVMSLGMAMTAMAGTLDKIADSTLEDLGIDPDKAENLSGWIDVTAADAGSASAAADSVKVTKDGDGYTVDFSKFAAAGYSKFGVVHYYEGEGQYAVSGKKMRVTTFSPFCLVGEKKSSEGGGGSSSGGSSSGKSPKTGMNDSWILWLMAAGVFAGTAVVYSKKRA